MYYTYVLYAYFHPTAIVHRGNFLGNGNAESFFAVQLTAFYRLIYLNNDEYEMSPAEANAAYAAFAAYAANLASYCLWLLLTEAKEAKRSKPTRDLFYLRGIGSL